MFMVFDHEWYFDDITSGWYTDVWWLAVDISTTFICFVHDWHDVTAQKMKFPLRISSVNVTESAENCGFGHIY